MTAIVVSCSKEVGNASMKQSSQKKREETINRNFHIFHSIFLHFLSLKNSNSLG